MIVRAATEADWPAWDAFAREHATAFHLSAWPRAVQAVHGHAPVCLMAEAGGEVTGILPLIDKRSALFGRALISVAFTVGGGVAALTDEGRDALTAAATREGTARGAAYVELRGGDVPEAWTAKEGVYASFGQGLEDDAEARLLAIPRKKRADVRKGIKAAEAGAIQARVTDDIPGFWSRYARAQRDHGTPVLPRRLLWELKRHLGDAMEVAEVFAGDAPLAGVVTFYHRGTAHLYHAYIGQDARRHHAGDHLYWWMMGHARARGCGWYDLGRSKLGTGSYAYKTHWGMAPEPLTYGYRLIGTDALPDINPKNPKFAAMTRAWAKLPLPVANVVGPRLYGHLG